MNRAREKGPTRRPKAPRTDRLGLLAVAAAVALLLSAGLAAATDTITESERVLASDGAAGHNFGQSVALDNSTWVVGAPDALDGDGIDTGAAYVYNDSTGSPVEETKLTPSDGASGDDFGWSVAVDGDTAIVGARFGETAYVYVESGGSWNQQATLTASDGEAAFGQSVALDGDTAIVGASNAAYVFHRSSGTWSEETKFTPSALGEAFARSVALDGSTVLVGAHSADTTNGQDSGKVYVFVEEAGSWSKQAELTASDGADSDFFGSSVALLGDRALVGAHGYDEPASGTGAAYVFERSAGSWSEETRFESGGGTADNFGEATALDPGRAIVGASGHGPGGAAYIFVHDGSWEKRAELLASDAGDGDRLGDAVALNGTALAGAPTADNENGEDAGAAYQYAGPSPPGDVRASPGPDADTITVDWDEPDDGGGNLTYSLERSNETGGPYTEVAETSELTYRDPGLDAEEDYYYVVSAEDSLGFTSNRSSEASTETLPAPPANLSASPGTNEGEIDLAWDEPDSSSGPFVYDVYRSTQDGGPYAFVAETSSTSYTDGDLESRTYHYVVRAVDGEGHQSPESQQASAEPAGDPPSSDDEQNDANTGTDASDDPDDPTVLAGGEVVHINGTLHPSRDPVDAFGTKISPAATTSMRFNFVSPPTMGLEVTLIDPQGNVHDADQASLAGGNAVVEATPVSGDHLAEGIWTTVLEHRASSLVPVVEDLGLPDGSAQTNVFDATGLADLPIDYGDERRCHPRC